jgi:colanic acid biosynthesis glycosyl transferase WcaI
LNVAVVSAVYPPEPVVSSRTSADVAAALHASGDRVTVVCAFPSRPHGRIHEGYRQRWRERTSVEDIDTIRTWSVISSKSTLASRMIENVSFGLSSMLALLGLRKLQVVYLNTWPIFATALAALVARLKRVPYVISVQDVYPESLLVQKRTAGRLIAPFLRWIDVRIARGAEAVIVLSEPFAAIYRDDRGVDPSRIHIVPNWFSSATHASREEALAYRRSRGIADDDFLVVYGGNVGVAAGVEQLIETFATIEDRRIRLLVAGGGAKVADCEALARRIGPERIQFHRPWREEETALVLAAADLLVLPTAGAQSRISVPSKLVSYLLAARPVLAIVERDSESARIVREAGAGWVVDWDALAASITAAAATDAAERLAMGERGRAYAERLFSRDRCVSRVTEILRGAAR